jgi:hypothetical protein
MDRKEDVEWIKKEVENWEIRKIIDQDQAQEILSLYELDGTSSDLKNLKKAGSSGLTTVVSVMGALLVGIGVILFVASNWKNIPGLLKLILLFGITFATYFAGWDLKFGRRTSPKLGHAIMVFGNIAFWLCFQLKTYFRVKYFHFCPLDDFLHINYKRFIRKHIRDIYVISIIWNQSLRYWADSQYE